MSIQTGFTTQALQRLATGAYNYATDVFALALYTDAASLSRDTTVYTTTGEYVGSGYVARGIVLTNVTPVVVNGELRIKWANVALGATMTPRGALVYNTSVSDEAVYVMDFGASANGTTVKFDEEAAIKIRV